MARVLFFVVLKTKDRWSEYWGLPSPYSLLVRKLLGVGKYLLDGADKLLFVEERGRRAQYGRLRL